MSDERRHEVLRAIVQDYVATSEPVGSKALLDRHRLGVSAATVRNDMAVLEEEGLITAPHTSAGRVPTDAGYRAFVDRLHEIKPMSAAERTAVQRFLDSAVDLDDVVDRTVRLLSSLTNQVAVMQYPSLNPATIRHIELVSLDDDRMMLVAILSNGRVEQRIVQMEGLDLVSGTGQALLRTLRDRVNEAVAGATWSDGIALLPAVIDRVAPEHQETAGLVIAVLSEALAQQREERVVLAGTAHLARSVGDFPMTIGPVLDALEEHVVLLRLLGQMSRTSTASGNAVAVRIGAENTIDGLRGASVVSAAYGTSAPTGLGVLGPTRMDYPGTMAAVRAVARYVSELVERR